MIETYNFFEVIRHPQNKTTQWRNISFEKNLDPRKNRVIYKGFKPEKLAKEVKGSLLEGYLNRLMCVEKTLLPGQGYTLSFINNAKNLNTK